MRCGCPNCGAYMNHSESLHLGCVCPECGRRCTDCLGTNTALSREQLRALRENPEAFAGFFAFSGRETGKNFPEGDDGPSPPNRTDGS